MRHGLTLQGQVFPARAFLQVGRRIIMPWHRSGAVWQQVGAPQKRSTSPQQSTTHTHTHRRATCALRNTPPARAPQCGSSTCHDGQKYNCWPLWMDKQRVGWPGWCTALTELHTRLVLVPQHRLALCCLLAIHTTMPPVSPSKRQRGSSTCLSLLCSCAVVNRTVLPLASAASSQSRCVATHAIQLVVPRGSSPVSSLHRRARMAHIV